MALLDRGHTPSESELRYFGVTLLAFGLLLGAIVFYLSGSTVGPGVIVAIGTLLCIVYYAVPSIRYPLYEVWMGLLFPIGWVISHALMGAIYYLILTPIGLLMRLFGRDFLARKRAAQASSYWKPMDQPDTPRRYFQQF